MLFAKYTLNLALCYSNGRSPIGEKEDSKVEVEVNYLAVVLAAASTMVVGSIWYSKAAFYKPWAKMAGVKEDPNFSGGQMAMLMGSVFLASLVTAYVLAHVTFLSNEFFKHSFLYDALMTSFWVWLGFTAMRMYTHDAFEGRRKKLTLLNASHELVTFLVMGLVIGLLGV